MEQERNIKTKQTISRSGHDPVTSSEVYLEGKQKAQKRKLKLDKYDNIQIVTFFMPESTKARKWISNPQDSKESKTTQLWQNSLTDSETGKNPK